MLFLGQSNPRSRLRILLQMLHLVSDCQELVKCTIKLLGEADQDDRFLEEGEKISEILETKLQSILLQLMKAFVNSNLKKQ